MLMGSPDGGFSERISRRPSSVSWAKGLNDVI
jgi:hypothetical protein